MSTQTFDRFLDGTNAVWGKAVAVVLAISLSLMSWSPLAIERAFAADGSESAANTELTHSSDQDKSSDNQLDSTSRGADGLDSDQQDTEQEKGGEAPAADGQSDVPAVVDVPEARSNDGNAIVSNDKSEDYDTDDLDADKMDGDAVSNKGATSEDGDADPEEDPAKEYDDEFTASVSIESWEYSGSFDPAGTFQYSSTTEKYGAEPTVEFFNADTHELLPYKPVNVGNYTVTVTWSGGGEDDGYPKLGDTKDFSITPRYLTIDALDTVAYDGQPHTLTVSGVHDQGTAKKYNRISGLVEGETVVIENASVTATEQGTYYIPENYQVSIFKPAAEGADLESSLDNYKVSVSGKLVISDGLDITLIAGNGGGVYNGTAYGLENVSARVSADESAPVVIEYRYGGGDWTTVAPSVTDVQDSLEGISVRASAAGCEPAEIDGLSIVVTPKPVTIAVSVKMDPDLNPEDQSGDEPGTGGTSGSMTSYTKEFDRMDVEYDVDDSYLADIPERDLIYNDAQVAGSVLAPQAVAFQNGEPVDFVNYAGTYTIDVSCADNGNYIVTTAPASVEITKAKASSFVVTVNIEDWAYGQQPNVPTSTYAPFIYDGMNTPTYLYKEKGADDAAYAETVPEQPGDYTVKVVYAATENCEELTATKDFSITQTTLIVTATSYTKAFGEADPELSYTITGMAYDMTESDARLLIGDITVSRTQGEAVGEYAISVSGAQVAGSYTVEYVPGTLTIVKADASTVKVGVSIEGWTYGDSPNQPVELVTGVNDYNEAMFEYKAVGADDSEYVQEYPRQAGTYTVRATWAATDNVVEQTATADFTISKAELVVTAVGGSKAFGASDPVFDATLSNVKNDDSADELKSQLNLRVSREAGEAAGHYAVNVAGEPELANYTVAYYAGDFQIEKATLTVTVANASKVYGADDPAFAYSVTGMADGETEEAAKALIGDVVITRPAGENVGHYVITASGVEETVNYTVEYVAGDLEITQGALVVTVNASKVYGEPDPVLPVSITGLASIDSQVAIEEALGLEISRMPGETAGHYAVAVSGAAATENYTVQYVAGDFEITKAPLTVTAASASKVYGDADPTSFTVSLAGLKNNDSEDALRYLLDLSVSREPGESVGHYAITATGVSELANYTVQYVAGDFRIDKAQITVTANDLIKGFGQDDPELTVTVSGLKGDDTEAAIRQLLGIGVTRESGEELGAYAITPTGETELANYVVEYKLGTMRIVQAEPGQVLVSVSIQGWTYGGSANAPATSVAGGYELGELTFEYKLADADDSTYTTNVPVNAGNYTVRATWAETESVATQTATADFTIERATLTVTVVDTYKSYGTPDPQDYTTILSGLTNGDSESAIRPNLELRFNREPGEDVGEYILEVKGVNFLENYALDYKSGMFTISTAAIVVTADSKTKVYDNDVSTDPELTATVTGVAEGTEINYTLSRTPGQNADDYAIIVILGDNPNYMVETQEGVFSITPAQATIEVDNATKVYGDSDPEFTGKISGLIDDGDLVVTYQRTGNAVNVGTYEDVIGASYSRNDNYNVAVVPGTLEITPRSAFVMADDQYKVYDNNPDTDPALSATSWGAARGDELNYTMTREPGQDAGAYEISVVLGANPNYAVETYPGTFTIAPKVVTVSANAASKVYGEADPALTATVSGVDEGVQINYTLTRVEGEDAGDYAIMVVPGDNGNYAVAGEGALFTIQPKEATVIAADLYKRYGEQDPTLTAIVSGTLAGDTLSYTLSRARGENAGQYAINVSLGDNPNYSVTPVSGTLTIAPKEASLTIADATKVYGDEDPAFQATADGTIAGDSLNYTFSREPGEDVGTYSISIAAGSNPNYAIDVTPGTLTITKRAATVSADDLTKAYDNDSATDPKLTATVDGAARGDSLDYALTREPGQAVGDYAISVELGDNPNYDATAVGGTFTIAPAAVTVAADDVSKVYGETDPELTATVTGVVEGDSLAYVLTREPGENAGEYPVAVTLGANPNYNVVAEGGTFTISPKAATVTADSKQKPYDKNPATDPELTATVSGVLDGDTVTYTLSRESGQDAGEYAITAVADANPNYAIETKGASFAITPVLATISADDATKTYGDADPGFTAVETGVIDGDALSYSFTRAEGEDVGEYAIGILAGQNPNYEVSVEGATLAIEPRNITVSADALTKVYGEADPQLTATVSGAVAGDEIAYTVTREEGENVGEYTLTVTAGDNPNYNVATASATFTVEKKSLVDPDSQDSGNPDFAGDFAITGLEEVTYTGQPQLASVAVVDRATGETVPVDVAYEGDTTNAGTVQVTIVADSDNYEGSVVKSYRIAPAPLTVTTPSATKVFDGTALTAEGSISGFVNGETATFETTGAQTEVGSSQNTYALTWDGTASAPNYRVTENLGTLEVTPVLYTLTVNYVLEDGSAAAPSTTEQHEADDAYAVTLPVLDGYYATDDAGNRIGSITGSMPERDLEVTITYVAEPVPPAPVPADDVTPAPADNTPVPAGDDSPAPAGGDGATPTAGGAGDGATPAVAGADATAEPADGDQAAAPAAVVTIDDEGNPLVEAIGDDANALASGEAVNSWSLFDTLVTVVTALLSALMLYGALGRKDEDDDAVAKNATRNRALGLASLVPAAAAIVGLLLTQDFTGQMAVFDTWSALFGGLGAVQIVDLVLSRLGASTPTATTAA